MNEQKKAQIEEILRHTKEENLALAGVLTDRISLEAYRGLVRIGEQQGQPAEIWTDALQTALNEHEVIEIPAKETPYYIDGTVTVPSNRRIEAADGAVICLLEGIRVLMLRNEHTGDGTHLPLSGENKDRNISICGGRWEESWRKRAGYRKTGMYDFDANHFYGVSTLMLFNNMEHLTFQGMEFAHTAGFSVQMGDISDVIVENIRFDTCYADGLHINGRTNRVWTRNLLGEVGDDLVALNMYDWQNSSVNFGPMKTVLVEDLESQSGYRAMRIEPGTYFYKDGSSVDCSIEDAIIRRVSGIDTFKMYYQTPRYNRLTEQPERGDVGSGNNLFFEDIDVDLTGPADKMEEYMNSDPVRGDFGAFEICSNLGYVSLKNIRLTLHREQFPYSYLVTIGPKSIARGEFEIFDPYVSCEVGELELSGITVNGVPMEKAEDLIKVIAFDDLYGDGNSSGRGKLHKITVK